MNKIIIIIFVLTMSIFQTSVYSADNYIVMKENSYLTLQDGNTSDVIDVVAVIVPYKKDNTVMLPLRYIFEYFNSSIDWDSETSTIDVIAGNTKAKFTGNSNQAIINGIPINLKSPITQIVDRSFIDIDTVCKVLGTIYKTDEDGFIYIGNSPEDKTNIKSTFLALENKLENKNKTLIFEDHFNEESKDDWVLETDGNQTETLVDFRDGVLDTFTTKGLTLWNKYKFQGNYRIEFDSDFILGNYDFERLSDLNFFWNATDPEHPDDFFADSATRGDFPTYNNLKLYYVGYGGNYNESTRMRKYLPDKRLIVGEYLCHPYLLEEGKTLKIAIEYIDGYSKVFRNNELIFIYYDKIPYNTGHFAFRTTINHVLFSNFKAYQLN